MAEKTSKRTMLKAHAQFLQHNIPMDTPSTCYLISAQRSMYSILVILRCVWY